LEGIQLARAYVEFESNFRDIIDDQNKLVRESQKAHKSMQSHIKDTVSSWLKVQEEAQNTADHVQSMGRQSITVFGAMSTALKGFTGILSFGSSMLRNFNKILVSVARTGISIFQRSLHAVIALINRLARIIFELVKRISQLFTYIATLPIRIIVAVNHARKSLSKWLDDLTKKFVFLQLDIRHIMHLMQRFLLVTVGAMGGATAAAAKFEDQFVVIRRVTEMTSEAYDELEKRLRSTASEIGRSAVELAELASVAGRLGIEGVQNLERFATIIGKLGVATVLHGEKSATEFARLMTVMNVAERDMNRLASTIVQLGNQFAAFEDEILAMSLQLAGAGAAIGVTVQEILGLATAMSAVDIRVERGGSAMSRVMIEVANAVSQGGEALETFAELSGMTADAFVETFRRDPMRAIFGFLQGLAEMQELPFQTLQDLNLAQIRTRDVVLRLLSAQEQLGRALDTSNIAWEENVALQREYAVAMDTVIAQGRKLIENLIEIARRVGDLFAEELKNAVMVMIDFVQALQNVDDETYRAIAGLLTLVSVIVGASAVLLSMARGFFTIMTAVVLVTRAIVWLGTVLGAMLLARRIMTFFTDTLDLNPIQMTIDLLQELRKTLDSLREAFVETDLGKAITETFEEIRASWQDFRGFLDTREDLEEALGREISEFEWMVRIATEFFNTIEASMTLVSDMIDTMRELIRDPDYSFWEDLTEEQRLELSVEEIQTYDAIRAMGQAFRDMISAAFKLAFRDIPGLFADAMTNIVFPEIWDRMEGEEGWLQGSEERLISWTKTVDNWADRIRMAREGITPEEEMFPEDIQAFLDALWDLGTSAGALFWEGVKYSFDKVGGPGITESFIDMMEDVADSIWGIEWDEIITIDPDTQEIEFHWDVLEQEREMEGALKGFAQQALRIYTGMLYQTFMALIHIPPWYKVGIAIADGLLRAIAFIVPGLEMGLDAEEGFQHEFDVIQMLRELQEGPGFSASAYGWMFKFLDWLPFIPDAVKDAVSEFVDTLEESSEDAESRLSGIWAYIEEHGVLPEWAKNIFKNIPELEIDIREIFESDRELSQQHQDLIEQNEDAKKLFKIYDEITAQLRAEDPIPIEFFLALAERESTFRADAVGDAGSSFGMLQVQDLAAQEAVRWFPDILPEFDLTVVEENIMAGILFAQGMFQRFDTELGAMIDIYDEIETKFEALMVMYRFGYPRFTAAAEGRGQWPTLEPLDVSRIETVRHYMEGYQTGGLLSGYGGGDKIPALLEAGEAIVPKEAVQAGAGGITSWFKSQGIPGFQEGALIEPGGFIAGIRDFLTEPIDETGATRDFDWFVDTGFDWMQEQYQMLQDIELDFDSITEGITGMTEGIYAVGDTIIAVIGFTAEKVISFLSLFFDLTEEQTEFLEQLPDDLTRGLSNILRRYMPEQPIDTMTMAAPTIEIDSFEYQRIDESPAWQATENALRRFVIRTSQGSKRLRAIMDELADGFGEVFTEFRQVLISDLTDEDTRGIFDDEVLQLIEAVSGARETFNRLQETDLFRTLRQWSNDTDSALGSIVEGFMDTPDLIRAGLSKGMDFLASGLEAAEGIIGINFGEMAIHASELAGAFGPLLGGLMSLITQTEAFETAMEIFNVIWDEIVAIVEPLGEVFIVLANAIRPIIQMIAAVLTPIMRILADILIGIIKVIAHLWNALLTILNVLTFGILGLDRFMIDISRLTEGLEDLNDEIGSARRNVPRIFRDAYAIWTLGHGTLPGEEVREEEEDERGIFKRMWDALTWLPKKIWEIIDGLGFFRTALLGLGIFLLQHFTGLPGMLISGLGSLLSKAGSALFGILPESVRGFLSRVGGGIVSGLGRIFGFGQPILGATEGMLAGISAGIPSAVGSGLLGATMSALPALIGGVAPAGGTVGAFAGLQAGLPAAAGAAGAGGGGLLAGLSGALSSLGGGIASIGAALGPVGIAAIAAGGLAYFFRDDLKELASSAWEGIKNIAGGVWDSITGFAGSAWDTIRDMGTGLFSSLGDVLSGIWGGISRVGSGIFEGVKRVGSGIFEGVKNVASGLASGVRNIASGIRNILPFATGGIITSPLLGLIGESGPEAVIPLDRLGDMMANVIGQQDFVRGSFETAAIGRDRGMERVLDRFMKRTTVEGGGTTIIIEGDVYGYEDFSRKVHEAQSRIRSKNNKSRYGVG